jgi:hypothetical protein
MLQKKEGKLAVGVGLKPRRRRRRSSPMRRSKENSMIFYTDERFVSGSYYSAVHPLTPRLDTKQ